MFLLVGKPFAAKDAIAIPGGKLLLLLASGGRIVFGLLTLVGAVCCRLFGK